MLFIIINSHFEPELQQKFINMSKKIYEAPLVEQMECKVEKGFAGSGGNSPESESNNGTQALSEGQAYMFS